MGWPLGVSPGDRFARLVVVSIDPAKSHGKRTALFRCDCGATHRTALVHVKRGAVVSCGCYRQKHGMCGTPEYAAWDGMIQRCTNPRNPGFARYGGRGIAVCEAWRSSFEDFFAHIGARPGPGYSIDRKDNSLGYEPGNVRWATRSQQDNNKRSNRLINTGGFVRTVTGWSRATGIRAGTIQSRLRYGWPNERAVTETVRPRRTREA